MKKINIPQKDLTNIIRKSIEKKLNEQKSEFSVETKQKETPREKQIRHVFGAYSEDIPKDVLRYMRKNPRRVLARLLDIYGMNTFNYIVKGLMDNKKDISGLSEEKTLKTEQVIDDDFSDEIEDDDDIETPTKSYPVDDVMFDLSDSDIEDIMDYKGPMRRFRGSIYYDGIVPETDNKDYDRKLAIKIIDWDRKHLKNGETYVGGAGFKQRNLLNPYDTMDF